MAYETIKYEKEDKICVVTLNRPERLNSLSRQLHAELMDALEKIMSDDEINVFIVTGAPRPDGRPCFSAGADLREGGSPGGPPGAASLPLVMLSAIQGRWAGDGQSYMNDTFPKLAIAAIDGVCTAGGLELALSFDIILVSETAQISDMHVKNLGVLGGAQSQQRLARRVGVSKAIELCCIGEPIDGKEAYRIGLANQVFPPDKLMEGAKEMAKKIAEMRPGAVAMTKATCRAIYDMDYRSALRFHDACRIILDAEPDAAEWGPARWVKGK